MSRFSKVLFAAVLMCLFIACHVTKKGVNFMQKSKPILSGIQGRVTEFKGNQMGIKAGNVKMGLALSTQVLIFKQLAVSQLVGLDGQWFQHLNSQPIKSQIADSAGNYQILLDPGVYSILVAYDGGYFIPFYNQYNQIATVHISKNQMIQLDIKVNTKAIY